MGKRSDAAVRAHLGHLESEFADLERLVLERVLPREVLQAVLHLSRHQKGIGLSDAELRVRLRQLQELHIRPEHRVQPRLNSDGQEDTLSLDDLKMGVEIC